MHFPGSETTHREKPGMCQQLWVQPATKEEGVIEYTYHTIRMFPPAIDIIPTLLAVVYSNGK